MLKLKIKKPQQNKIRMKMVVNKRKNNFVLIIKCFYNKKKMKVRMQINK